MVTHKILILALRVQIPLPVLSPLDGSGLKYYRLNENKLMVNNTEERGFVMNDEISINEQIRIKIERVGINRNKLCEMLNITYDQLQNYLHERSQLDDTTIRYLVVFLDTIEHLESLYSANAHERKKTNE